MPYTVHNDGYLAPQTAPLTKNGVHPLVAMAVVLGPPQTNYKFDPSQVNAVENFTLSKLMEGKQDFIGITLQTVMQSANPAVFSIFEMKPTGSKDYVHISYDFPKEPAVRTAAQAPPPYVKVVKSSRSGTLSMYRLGATTSVQELRTTEGQFLWKGKLTTVAIGFIEVAELLVIESLLGTPSMYAKWYVESGQHLIDLARAGRLGDQYWDILRRNDNGFFVLMNLVRQSFAARNLNLTHCALAEGVRGQVMMSPLKTEYSRHGPGAASNAEKLAD